MKEAPQVLKPNYIRQIRSSRRVIQFKFRDGHFELSDSIAAEILATWGAMLSAAMVLT